MKRDNNEKSLQNVNDDTNSNFGGGVLFTLGLALGAIANYYLFDSWKKAYLAQINSEQSKVQVELCRTTLDYTKQMICNNTLNKRECENALIKAKAKFCNQNYFLNKINN